MGRATQKAVDCPVEITLRVLDGRWKVIVLRELFGGVKRFSALRRALIGISHRTLTQQLRQLEASRIIRRKVFRQVPPKVEYSLTPLGNSLQPILAAMRNWGEAYSKRVQPVIKRPAGAKKAKGSSVERPEPAIQRA